MRLERLRRVTCKGGAYCRVDVEDYDDVKRFLGPRVSRRWKSGRHEDVHVTRQMAIIFTEVKEQPRISFTALDKAIGMLQQIACHHIRSQQGAAYKFDYLNKNLYPFPRNSDTKITTKISIYFHKFHACTTHLQLVDDACFPNAAIRWAGSWHDLANGRSNNIINVFLCSCFADVCTSHGLYWCRGALKSQNCWVYYLID